ncbi:YesL family protein [Bacillus suaedae]|uniref:DUF624 domain-containing protein n=1 Tax=Halalkalibacter suaedae TaxID=2822140 RepID=A0A940WTA8_9BACI|nr:DUF624 domain-containing protein [Bacillus suaedae]MBP3951901.1 DUF624 domain-containing protein [Bacillus suaedae]
MFTMDSLLYKFTVWFMRLAYVNILWIVLTITGLGVFGFFPSTVAMFAVVRHWIRGDTEIPILITFWSHYKTNFMKTNMLGMVMTLLGLMIYWNLLFFISMNNQIGAMLFYLTIALALVYFVVVSFIIPVYVHYDLKVVGYLKYAFIISLSYPHHALYIGFSSIVMYYATLFFPVLFLFFSGSFLSLLIMRFAYVVFERVERKNSSKEVVAAEV